MIRPYWAIMTPVLRALLARIMSVLGRKPTELEAPSVPVLCGARKPHSLAERRNAPGRENLDLESRPGQRIGDRVATAHVQAVRG